MSEVSLVGVTKLFDNGFVALSDIHLTAHSGELMVFVGPSGCGKSTLLRIIAGLEEPTAGQVVIGGTDVTDLSPARRNIAMVFQNYALYPHMTVRKNMELGLRMRGVPKRERDVMISRAAEMLGLTELLDRRPAQLSGGQRQRVAMGRALVRDPSVFLLDEPLSNLDAKLRVQMRTEIRQLQRYLRATMVFVTHDQTEAMTMADRIAVMRHGEIQQVGAPQAVYDSPANLFVADFIGSPPMNLMQVVARRRDDGVDVTLRDGTDYPLFASAESGDTAWIVEGREVIVGLRPEALDVVAGSTASSETGLPGTVALIEPLGGETYVHLDVPAPRPVTLAVREVAADVDATTLDALNSAGDARFIVRVPADSRFSIGQRVSVVRRAGSSMHLFDPADSLATTTTLTGRVRKDST